MGVANMRGERVGGLAHSLQVVMQLLRAGQIVPQKHSQ